jgi:hypothetical protein
MENTPRAAPQITDPDPGGSENLGRTTFLDRAYLPAFVGAFFIVVLSLLADLRVGDAASMRSSDSITRLQQVSLTDESLRYAYGSLAPAALRSQVASNHQQALVAAAIQVPEEFTTISELSLLDGATIVVDRASAAQLATHDFDLNSFLAADISDDDLLRIDLDDRAKTARSQDSEALTLRGVAVLVTVGLVLAMVALSVTARATSRGLVAGAWAATVVAIGFAVLTLS